MLSILRYFSPPGYGSCCLIAEDITGLVSRTQEEPPINAKGYDMSCEWNPTLGKPATSEDEIHARATLCVGVKESWHLCDDCAKLPYFNKYRSRIALCKYGQTEDKPCSTTD